MEACSKAASERARKGQEVILRALAKKLTAGRQPRSSASLTGRGGALRGAWNSAAPQLGKASAWPAGGASPTETPPACAGHAAAAGWQPAWLVPDETLVRPDRNLERNWLAAASWYTWMEPRVSPTVRIGGGATSRRFQGATPGSALLPSADGYDAPTSPSACCPVASGRHS